MVATTLRACPTGRISISPRTIPMAGRAWWPRWTPLGVAYELFPCDPALADTAAFCAAYGFAPEESANTILVIGKSDPPRYAACVVLAPNRLDVNRAVRDRLGTRKASFAPAESTREITGMEIGGVTVFGLPDGLPIWVDARVMAAGADRARWWVAVVEGAWRRRTILLALPRCRGRRRSRDRSAGAEPQADARPPVSFRRRDRNTDPTADPTPTRRSAALRPAPSSTRARTSSRSAARASAASGSSSCSWWSSSS